MIDIDPVGAFVVGLLGGVHCIGMCGGIVGAISLGMPGEQRSRWPMLLAYNTGRIASYTLAGAIAGGLGFFFSGLLPVQQAQQVLLGIAGLFMILLGLYLGGWWNLLARLEQAGGLLWKKIEPLGRGLLPARRPAQALALGALWGWRNLLSHVEKAGGYLWRRIEPLGRGLLPVRHIRQALVLGALWGWLPCGLVYSVLIWSVSAGGAGQGALLMLAFGLGTLPNLLAMGAAAAQLQRFVRLPWVRQAAGLLIILFGVFQLSRLVV